MTVGPSLQNNLAGVLFVFRLERIEAIAAKHGASLLEYAVLDLLANFAMSREEVAGYVSKILKGSPYENASCAPAIDNCLAKSWIQERDSVVMLTPEGSVRQKAISTEVWTPPS
jgi:hypothetical protein